MTDDWSDIEQRLWTDYNASVGCISFVKEILDQEHNATIENLHIRLDGFLETFKRRNNYRYLEMKAIEHFKEEFIEEELEKMKKVNE